MRLLAFMLSLFSLASLLNAQQLALGKIHESDINGKSVNFKTVIETMLNAKHNLYIRDVTIRWEDEIDRPFVDGRFFLSSNPEQQVVKHMVEFINCDFDPLYWVLLRNVKFESYLSIIDSKNAKFIFKDVEFIRGVKSVNNSVEFLDFKNCTFQEGFKLIRSLVTDFIRFDSCHFNFTLPDNKHLLGLDQNPVPFEINNRIEAINVEIINSHFNMSPDLVNVPDNFIKLSNTRYNNLKLSNNVFHGNVDFSESTVENLSMIRQNEFHHQVFFNAFNTNELNTKISWEDVRGGKIAVYSDGKIFNNENVAAANLFEAADLFSSYASIHNSFKSQGMRIYANACYVEWKDAETVWLGRYYKEAETNLPFFMLLMNRFLLIFCDYGTNPLKSVLISIYIILAFGVIFMFTSDYSKYPEYNIVRFIKDALSSKFQSSEFVKGRFFEIKSKPNTRIFTKMQLGLLSFLQYTERSNSIKVLALATLLVLTITASFIHCLLLSLNIYSTLGFGNIPQRGIFRVMSIAEGICGWFLLSIFSVSLISQILQ
jgi:hypothetical protein